MQHKALSPLEQEVMTVVWELNSCSVRDVLERLRKHKQLAYTTVATILQRLYDKGLVNRIGKGIAFLYSPKLSKESYSITIARSFINKFITSFGDVAITSFADSIESLPKKKKEYLLKLLENHDKTK